MADTQPLNSLPSVFSPLAKALLDGFSEGVIVFDPEGRLIYANSQARAALVGMDLSEGAPDMLPRLAALTGTGTGLGASSPALVTSATACT